MTAYYIYALCEPDLWQEVRYVGASTDPHRRLTRHLCPAGLKRDTPNARWLKGLVAQGAKPLLVILEQVNDDAWEEAERKWVAYYLAQGANLTNVNTGGKAGSTKIGSTKHAPPPTGLNHSQAAKALWQRRKATGWKWSEAAQQKKSRSMRAVWDKKKKTV